MRTPEQFWAKVEKSDGCWLWSGARTAEGYGNLRWLDGYDYAHRVAYELLVGPIPQGLVLDHLCRVRQCVRPTHVEAVTPATNTSRGLRPYWSIRTRCKHGHDITDPGNVYTSPDGTHRCRQCGRDQAARRYRGRRAA